MSVFIRRFLSDPGNEVLLEIESVNILDLDPPASISGIGTGTVICVGEFENGPFNEPTEVTSATDFVQTFGGLGYTIGGVSGENPSARTRKADGAIAGETWNGNGFVQLNAKKFKRLLLTRVDTSVGYIELRRQAYVTGAAAFAYNLEPAQVLSLDIGAGPVSATFSATAATTTSAAGVFPTLFVGGETLTLGYDGLPNFVVTFQASDQSQAQVVARINAFAGFAFATVGGGGTTLLTGIQRGTGGQVRVVAASAGGVFTATGFSVVTVFGTGNVANIDAVKFTEVKSITEAAIAGCVISQDSAGKLRASKTFVTSADYIQVGPLTTATALGFTVGAQGTSDGIANMRSTAGTFPITVTASITLGVDSESDFVVPLVTADTQAAVITKINAAAGFTMASSFSATITVLRGRANGGQVRVVGATNATLLSDLGLTVQTISTPALAAGVVPAGTLVTNTAATARFVTMVDADILAPSLIGGVYSANAGPYQAKVRHALDDGTGASALGGSIVVSANPIDLGSFAVVNPVNLTTALSETAIDAKYTEAIDSTLDLSTVAREANLIFAARQSNTIRRALKANAINASAIGMFGRMAVIRPPLGTTKAAARSNVAEPGVGAYRDQRVIYTFPGASSFVPIIGLRGLTGGVGFTADGFVDLGADGFMASILSQLPPEENPGQLTPFASGAVGLESSPNAQHFTMTDYINFRASGIAALRIDDGTTIFQSGVTSVDPLTFPNLRNIARRRMADFIQDSLARRSKAFGKKLSTFVRRKALTGEVIAFLTTLLSANNPAFQRIAGFEVDDTTGNTQTTLGMGLYRLIIRVRTLASLDSIVLETTIGESVVVAEAA